MYTFDSRIRYSEADSEGKLTMSSLINYFQDCSTFQSEDLGIGIDYLKEQKIVWVLSSWQIVVERYPRIGERVTIGTQPYDLKGFLGYRNFAMMAEDGSFLAKANSLWSLLGTETGKPVSIPENIHAKYEIAPKLEMEYAPRKIAVPEGGENLEPIVVKKHNLDTNHHVNNEQFVELASACLSEEIEIKEIRVEYKKQAFLHDVLVPYLVKADGKDIVALRDAAGAAYAVVEFIGK